MHGDSGSGFPLMAPSFMTKESRAMRVCVCACSHAAAGNTHRHSSGFFCEKSRECEREEEGRDVMVLACLLIIVDVPIRDALATLFSGVMSCCCCLFVDVSCRRVVWRLIVCLQCTQTRALAFKNSPPFSNDNIHVTLLFLDSHFSRGPSPILWLQPLWKPTACGRRRKTTWKVRMRTEGLAGSACLCTRTCVNTSLHNGRSCLQDDKEPFCGSDNQKILKYLSYFASLTN